MSKQDHIDALKRTLGKIRVRRAMLEAAASPDLRDRELRRRLAETETQQSVALEQLARLGIYPDDMNPEPPNNGARETRHCNRSTVVT